MHVHTASCFGKDPVATRSATAVLPEEATAVFHSVKVSRRGKPNLFIKGTEALSGRNRGSIRTKRSFYPEQTEALFREERSFDQTERTATKAKQKLFSVKYIGSIRRRKKPRRNRKKHHKRKAETIFSKIHRVCSVKKEATPEPKEVKPKQKQNSLRQKQPLLRNKAKVPLRQKVAGRQTAAYGKTEPLPPAPKAENRINIQKIKLAIPL